MQISIFGDRRGRMPPGWVKETLVGIFGDLTLNASARPGSGASLTVFGLFSEATVHVPPGARVTQGGFSVFGDHEIDVPGDNGDSEIRIKTYGLFCDTKVIEERT